MKLSAPVHVLKRKARRVARAESVPLHAALDRLAAAEGYPSWSFLAARLAAASPGARLLAELSPGDMLLIGARPGQGKTLAGLELAVEAMRRGGRAAFFTLEYTERDVRDRFRAIGADYARFEESFLLDCSDAVDAGYIIKALHHAPRGALAVVDYLQLLDRRRDSATLDEQMRMLRAFARERGVIFVIPAQIDRSFAGSGRDCPDIRDVRLSNPLDLRLFNKTCFLNEGRTRFRGA